LKCRGIDAILKVKDIWTGKFSNQKAIAAWIAISPGLTFDERNLQKRVYVTEN
jgi:hypothetical protein